MGILTTLSSAIVSYCAASVGSTVGAAASKIGAAILKYVWLEADSGYFKDFPEDENREHTFQNIMFRISVVIHEVGLLSTVQQDYTNNNKEKDNETKK